MVQRTDSNRCYDIAEGTVRQVQNTDRLLVGCTDCKYGGQRLERAVFNLLCAVSKIRFVTIDCDDAHCCNEQIKRLQQNSESVTDRLKQQLCAVKLYW